MSKHTLWVDLTGRKFGHWTVIESVYSRLRGYQWLCQCDCGHRTLKVAAVLRKLGPHNACHVCAGRRLSEASKGSSNDRNNVRNADIIRRRLNRERLQTIGDRYHISRERVRQIVEARATPEQKQALGSLESVNSIAKQLGFCSLTIRKIIAKLPPGVPPTAETVAAELAKPPACEDCGATLQGRMRGRGQRFKRRCPECATERATARRHALIAGAPARFVSTGLPSICVKAVAGIDPGTKWLHFAEARRRLHITTIQLYWLGRRRAIATKVADEPHRVTGSQVFLYSKRHVIALAKVLKERRTHRTVTAI